MKILVVSDIHANLAALKAVLADAPSVDRLWNLGDTVGYGPRPGECLEEIRARDASPALVGNHDLACIGAVNLAEFNPVAQAASRWTARQLTADHRAYLKDLPSATATDGVTLAHGSPRDPVWEYVTTAAVATANFACFETGLCLVGHTHQAMHAELDPGESIARVRPLTDGATVDLSAGRHLINPGSVGQPRDRDPRAAYAILDTDAATLTATRVEYDILATQRGMERAGLPEVLRARLALGR
jgi:diadenosine tetraphosphatase ApaH/serine/threonine PP2A family protein phosphatase